MPGGGTAKPAPGGGRGAGRPRLPPAGDGTGLGSKGGGGGAGGGPKQIPISKHSSYFNLPMFLTSKQVQMYLHRTGVFFLFCFFGNALFAPP